MSRRLLRPALLGVVIIGIAALFLRSVPEAGLDRILDLPASERLPELMQRVRSFNRVVTRGGKRLLEVSAQEASYFRGDRAVAVVEPRIAFYDEGQPVGSLQGNTGKLYLDGNEIRLIEMDGGVRLKFEQFTLETERLSYERDREIIISTGPTSISSAEINLSGTDMAFDLQARTLRLDADVRMRIAHDPTTPAGAGEATP